ncbi:hypothetical protein AvCA_16570 [Azotobacter vinelandii CA]|uniref:Uncharacterized protein n=2 Tax=Azotobacter vinelandii TaxID=354 RepID=C1DSB5_AZOVD|nr:hypothetical protein Avin_16570 [Azotobacter vinelandii DJ]AGK16957.1 hypothetical protein AvCA_16570 [Azotobacter vinelandii CA]AGK20036.1 hypothetical protein AvCA6_16570 [Azotobacter vinelandii CA6]
MRLLQITNTFFQEQLKPESTAKKIHPSYVEQWKYARAHGKAASQDCSGQGQVKG